VKITPTCDDSLDIESPLVSLRGVRPVLNGAPLDDARAEIVANDATRIELRYTAPRLGDGVFGVEVTRQNESRAWLRYWVENWAEHTALDSFGLCFDRVENLRSYLCNGYTSWDGSFYVEPESLADFEPYETRPETGFAMTQLLPRMGSGSVVVGFDRHDRFQQTFFFNTRLVPPSLTVQTLWDRRSVLASREAAKESLISDGDGSVAKNAPRHDNLRCESERLVIFEHTQVEEALRDWARIVAQASPTPPRSLPRTPTRRVTPGVAQGHGASVVGWCSWYNLYGYINEENILAHLRGVAEVARREALPMRVFQIDDGFTPEMGDWLQVKPQFPRGMKPLLDDIRAAGFTPGLWIAPFMVGNRSRLYREHPDWVVRERATNAPLTQWRFYGEFRWHKRSEEYYILDTTHPDAFDYLQRVLRVWRHDWGCEYFKTDFMFWGAEYGPDRARWHTEGMTRVEIWRRVAEMIRAEIGDATWLGSGCPLWMSVGLVDGVRIGSDVGVEWRGHLSAQSLLRDQATRNFANRILWQTDPDCILLRERFHHLSEAEVRSLALYAGMSGGVAMTSDALDELSPERLRLWKLLLSPHRATCRFPFLGQSHIAYGRWPADLASHHVRHAPVADPVLVQVRGDEHMSAIFIFNTGDAPVQRTYPLDALGIADARYVYDWTRQTFEVTQTSKVSVTLAPHDGALLFISPTPMTAPPDRLP